MPRLIRIGESVFEVIGGDPDGSAFLLNRTGMAKREIADLERRLAGVRSKLAALDAEAVEAVAVLE